MRCLTTLLSFVLACASSVIVARAQSQTMPGLEVKKLGVMVGTFTIEDEVKAGQWGRTRQRRNGVALTIADGRQAASL